MAEEYRYYACALCLQWRHLQPASTLSRFSFDRTMIEPFFKFSVLLLVLFCLSYRLKSDMHRQVAMQNNSFKEKKQVYADDREFSWKTLSPNEEYL